MKITSVMVLQVGGHETVSVFVDGKLTGVLMVDIGEGEKLASLLRVKAMATGAEPSWLVKDFNVLYRAALAFSEACAGRGDARPYPLHLDLQAQLKRLEPAFQETEAMREWMGERG
jgi:hypothetical protein